MAHGRHLTNRIRPYICNNLTDCREVWHGKSYWPSEPYWQLKFQSFKHPKWRTVAILKNRKLAISTQRLDRLARNSISVRWCTLVLRTLLSFKISKFYKSKMADGRHFEKSKIYLSNGSTDWREIWHCDTYLL